MEWINININTRNKNLSRDIEKRKIGLKSNF